MLAKPILMRVVLSLSLSLLLAIRIGKTRGVVVQTTFFYYDCKEAKQDKANDTHNSMKGESRKLENYQQSNWKVLKASS